MKKHLFKTATAGLVVVSGVAAVYANSAKADEVENTPSDTNTSVATASTQTAIKTSAEVKQELDKQTQEVHANESAVSKEKFNVDYTQNKVNEAQAAVDTANQAVAEAQKTADKATAENIEAVQDKQKANVLAQATNTTATDNVTANITAQHQVVADAQTSVDTAQTAKDQADQAVTNAQTNVDSAQATLDNTGASKAQEELDAAKQDVKTAESNATKAETELESVKKADSERAEKVTTAEKNLTAKTEDAERKKKAVDNATETATKAEKALSEATEAVTAAEKDSKKLIGEDKTGVYSILLSPEYTDFNLSLSYYRGRALLNSQADYDALSDESKAKLLERFKKQEELYKEAAKYFGDERMGQTAQHTIKPYAEVDKTRWVDIRNMSLEEATELNEFAIRVFNDLREQYAENKKASFTPSKISTGVIQNALNVAKAYMDKYMTTGYPTGGHDRDILNQYGIITENIFSGDVNLDSLPSNLTNFIKRPDRYHYTMAELKSKIVKEIQFSTFNDSHANWGHALHNVSQYPYTAISFVITDKNTLHMHTLSSSGANVDTSDKDKFLVTNRQYLDSLKAQSSSVNISELKDKLTKAQTAANNAKESLVTAQADYTKAQELLTQAEKTLADAKATPLQTETAENNLVLAQTALKTAQERQEQAQKAVDNFSADVATKQANLDSAKEVLADAKAKQATAKANLETAKANLTKQQQYLTELEAHKVNLLAEKDRLAQETKDLATELDSYLNAEANLETAKVNAQKAQAALELAQAQLAKVTNSYNAAVKELDEAKAKQAELQSQYEQLLDFEENNVITVLPDGTVVAVPKDAPTTDELPEYKFEEKGDDTKGNKSEQATTSKAEAPRSAVKTVSVVKPQAFAPNATTTGQNPTYSRVERAKTLPQTGDKNGSIFAVIGSVLATIGLAGVKRKRAH